MKTTFAALVIMFGMLAIGSTADHYVRSDASGDNSGLDWENAYTQLPAALMRGETYYLADGSYGLYTFDDPVSGTQVITVRKATVADHGTDTGWQDGYGDGVAEFQQIMITTGYFDLDGATGGGPGSWKTGHGMLFTQDAGIDRTFIVIAEGVSNVSIRRIKFMEVGDIEQGRYGANGILNATTVYDLLVERCYFENLNGLPFFFRGGSGVTIQHNFSGDICGCSVWSSDWHCEGLVLHSLSDVDYRWNYISECPSSGGFVKNSSSTSSSVRIYGNIFRDGYAVNCNTGSCPGWRIFNNTFATGGGSVGGDGARIDWMVYNNIVFDSGAGAMPPSHGYNLFIQPTNSSCDMNAGESENVITRYPSNCDLIIDVSDPFINSWGDMPEDFRLAHAVADWDGYDVCRLDTCDDVRRYNYDLLGSERGVDGSWDRGALEYPPALIFFDGFEGGGTGSWSGAVSP